MFFCRKYKTAVICRIRVIGVPLKRKAFLLRTLHADVPTFSSLIAHNSLPKNMFFCQKNSPLKKFLCQIFLWDSREEGITVLSLVCRTWQRHPHWCGTVF